MLIAVGAIVLFILGDLILADYFIGIPYHWFSLRRDGYKVGFFEYAHYMGFGGPAPAGLFPPPKTRWARVAEAAFWE